MKPGDRICIIGNRQLPTGFMIYATNVIPMNVSIPGHFTDEEAREMLLAVASIYEKTRQRLVTEDVANERMMAELRGSLFPQPAERPDPTIEQMVSQALGIRPRT